MRKNTTISIIYPCKYTFDTANHVLNGVSSYAMESFMQMKIYQDHFGNTLSVKNM